MSFRNFRYSSLAALFCGLFVCALAQAADPTASLEGSVLNKITGAPVKHAHVMYIKVPGPASFPISTDTDADGRFAIPLEAGDYRLWVERPGFARQAYGSRTPDGTGTVLSLAPGQQIRDITLRIVPLGAISGHVFDEDGEPMQGVGIQVLRFSYATGRRQLISVAGSSSNDRGEYRAYSLPAGRYFLLATLRGAPLSVPAEANALVPEIQEPFASMYYPGVLDFASASQISLPEGGELTDADFHLQRVRAVTVRGRILSPIQDPASAQVQVVLAHNDGNTASFINRTSAAVDQASGRFEFRGIAPGSYLLVGAELSGNHPLGGRLPIEVTTAMQQNLTLSLTSGFAITGAVELEGDASVKLPNLTLRLSPAEGLALGPQPTCNPGPDGSIRLAGITPGIWDFNLDPLPEGVWIKTATFGGQDVLRGELNVSSGSRGPLHIVLANKGARISGSVSADGQPHHATVILVPAAAEMQGSIGMYRATTTQEQGAFTFQGVRPGSYKLFALEEVEPFAWLDPDFLKPVESLGESISVSEGEHATRQLAPISPDLLLPAR